MEWLRRALASRRGTAEQGTVPPAAPAIPALPGGRELAGALGAGLPGTVQVNERRRSTDFVNVNLASADGTGRLWSCIVILDRPGDGRASASLLSPAVEVAKCGKAAGPRLLMNLVDTARGLGIDVVKAHASMSMGRALTTFGFLPARGAFLSLRNTLPPVLREAFADAPPIVAADLIRELESREGRMAWSLVPGPGDTRRFGEAESACGDRQPVALQYPEQCRRVFASAAWSAELDLTDPESLTRYEWHAARCRAAGQEGARAGDQGVRGPA